MIPNCLLIIAITLTGIANTMSAQLFENSKLRGILVDDSTGRPVVYAHIFNESRKMGVISDENGEFSLFAETYDTLIFTALNFDGKIVELAPSVFEGKYVIVMHRIQYEIDEVSIMGFRDYEDFKRKFIALELPETPTDRLRENLAALSIRNANEAVSEDEVRRRVENPWFRPVNGNIPIYSKEDLQRMNFEKVLKHEEKLRVIDEKYNRDIIYQVTKLSQDEITDFMGFCHFDEDYLFRATPYQIVVRIEQKFKEYKKMKEKGELIDSNFMTDWLYC